jgi:hypothetical protein
MQKQISNTIFLRFAITTHERAREVVEFLSQRAWDCPLLEFAGYRLFFGFLPGFRGVLHGFLSHSGYVISFFFFLGAETETLSKRTPRIFISVSLWALSLFLQTVSFFVLVCLCPCVLVLVLLDFGSYMVIFLHVVSYVVMLSFSLSYVLSCPCPVPAFSLGMESFRRNLKDYTGGYQGANDYSALSKNHRSGIYLVLVLSSLVFSLV